LNILIVQIYKTSDMSSQQTTSQASSGTQSGSGGKSNLDFVTMSQAHHTKYSADRDGVMKTGGEAGGQNNGSGGEGGKSGIGGGYEAFADLGRGANK
jgi:hypothetical protein